MEFTSFAISAKSALIVVQEELLSKKKSGGEVQKRTNLCMNVAGLSWPNMRAVGSA